MVSLGPEGDLRGMMGCKQNRARNGSRDSCPAPGPWNW